MLWCLRYRKRLGAYLDGEMALRKQRAVARHLAKCASCRAVLEDLRALAPVLRSLDAPPPCPDQAGRILAEARRRRALSLPGQSPLPPSAWSPLRWFGELSIPMRLATCVMMFIAFSLGTGMGRTVFSLEGRRIAGAEGLEGIEWFSPTPPNSLGNAYLVLTSSTPASGEARR